MQHTTTTLEKTRRNIVKNDILNKLLIATLSNYNSPEPFIVATTSLPIHEETRERLREKGIILPAQHLLYDVVVCNSIFRARIGLRYPGHPVIWKSDLRKNDLRGIAKLKDITETILKSYPSLVNDFVFPSNDVMEKQLSDYRTLNHLLILLLKDFKHAKLIFEQETLFVEPSTMNQSLLFSYHNSNTKQKQSDIIYLTELRPQTYHSSKIPIELIYRLLTNYRKK